MSKSIVSVMLGNYTEKFYSFFTDIDDLAVGDYVVCDTVNGPALGTVMKVDVTNKATKWVIDKVSMDAHLERLKREEKKRVLKAKLYEMKKDLEEIAIFEMLAEKNPEVKNMLDELKSLEA